MLVHRVHDADYAGRGDDTVLEMDAVFASLVDYEVVMLSVAADLDYRCRDIPEAGLRAQKACEGIGSGHRQGSLPVPKGHGELMVFLRQGGILFLEGEVLCDALGASPDLPLEEMSLTRQPYPLEASVGRYKTQRGDLQDDEDRQGENGRE